MAKEVSTFSSPVEREFKMKSDIRWDEIAKIEMRPGAPELPTEAVRAIAKHAPMPRNAKKTRPANKGRVRKGKGRS